MTCDKCRLHMSCRTVKVRPRSVGAKGPVVMFVGEAPGSEEDQQGQAFVGPAGQLLDQAIQEYNLAPCFITNVVRCQPPGNRPPRTDEVAACFAYLAAEIKALRPKVVVCLGNTPLRALTGQSGISSFSGSVVQEQGGIKVFALFHPAFILRVPAMLPKFEMHLRELKRLISAEGPAPALGVLDLEPKDAFDLLVDAKNLVAFDYETSGLFKGEGGYVRAVGFSTGEAQFVVNARAHEADAAKLMRWFLNSDIEKAAYNSAFETRWSIEEYGVRPKNLRYDPMLMHFLLDENSSKDLESVASQYLKAGKWGIEALMLKNGWTYETIPYEQLVPYCGADCFYTYNLSAALMNKLILKTEASPSMFAYRNILLPLAKVCAELEVSGIFIDQEWAKEQHRLYTKKAEALLKEIRGLEVCRSYCKQMSVKKYGFELNLRSPIQIREIVFGRLGFSTRKTTKVAGLMSTNQDVLDGFRQRHPFIDLYLEWKGTMTTLSNFLEKFPSYCDAKGIIHPHYNPVGTVTGRLASTNPPAQTFDESPSVRGMLRSRFPGGKIISSDYSQLELRILASEADEERLIEAFAQGKDPHGITAQMIFGSDFSKAQRMIGKTINFGIAYGIQAGALASKFNVGFEIAEAWLDHFWKSYPKIRLWMNRQHEFVKKHGWIKSRFGRVRHLPEILSGNLEEWQRAGLLRQAGNFPIQSQGADINNLATIKLHAEMNRLGSQGKIILPLHDAIILDSPTEEAEELLALSKKVMEDQMRQLCSWLQVKLEVSQSVSERWGQ